MNYSDPLRLRVTQCPNCEKVQLVDIEELSKAVVCNCGTKFIAGDQLLFFDQSTKNSPYTTWKCPHCKQQLLVPNLAIAIPGRCSCGNSYPFEPNTLLTFPLANLDDAIIGNDPLEFENMMKSYRAAERYHYDFESIGDSSYKVINPTTGKSYTVTLNEIGFDVCECDVFSQGGETCIHIEHLRLRLGLPSPSRVFVKEKEFAYAWFDKSCLPPRIRIGFIGEIEKTVRIILQDIRVIATTKTLDEVKRRFEKQGIAFRVLTSVKQTMTSINELPVDLNLAREIENNGRNYLKKCMPDLKGYQIDGAVFLATSQRALLLDEMGLGKTVQAIAGAYLLQEFGNLASCLIVAPKSVMAHWVSELHKFAKEDCIVIQGDARTRYELYRKPNRFKVVTLESLRRDFPNIEDQELLIVDEVHKVRGLRTLSNRVMQNLKSRFFFGLSGTAIEKSLEDLYGILKAARCPNLESSIHFYASHMVCDQFGKTKFTLHPEFFFVRYSDRILRRTKSEVEQSLPELIIKDVELELTPLQEKMAQPLCEELKSLKSKLQKQYNVNDFIRHRWIINRIVELSDSTALLDTTTSSSSKLKWLSCYLQEICTKSKEKIVIFTRWTRTQKLICELCESLNLPYRSLCGSDDITTRNTVIDEFNKNETLRVFASTDAGGVGVNLQVACHVVNFEPAWNPSTNAQRIQRVHRIGQILPVQAINLLTILDQLFVLATHGQKSFSSDKMDSMQKERHLQPYWKELLPVIQCFHLMAKQGGKV